MDTVSSTPSEITNSSTKYGWHKCMKDNLFDMDLELGGV